MRKLLPHEIPTKQCVLCGSTFSKRKPAGGMYTADRWAAKVCCSNVCHLKYNWNLRRETIPERFWRQVDRRGDAECWPYTGASRDHKGYGGFHLEGKKTIRAHRMAYLLAYGTLKDTLMVRHKCDNPACCNPTHLELGTAADNNQDRDSRGRHIAFTRANHPATKITPEQLPKFLLEYRDLPKGPKGGRSPGTVDALAKRWGINKTYASTLGKKGL